ncbi:hypothetical protein ACFVKJ_14710, partial [Streptomyces rochei]
MARSPPNWPAGVRGWPWPDAIRAAWPAPPEHIPASRPIPFDAYVPESCARAVREASAALGGLDAVVVAFGAVAFGTADEVGDEVAEHLTAVNHLAPAAFFRAALGVLRPGSAIAAVTGAVAER